MADHHAPAGTEQDDPGLDGTDHRIPSGPADGLRISVVIPCHLALPFLPSCVDTLTSQTLPRDDFEAIFVFNGPEDGGYDVARDLLAESGLHHQLARSSRGISPARNVGASVARAPWLTLLDVDDSLTPNYLEAMLASATDETVVPVAGIVDVGDDGVEMSSHINETILAREGIVDPVDLIRPLSISTLKLVPIAAMRRHPFDPAMRSGEDVALWTDLFEAEGLRFDTTPAFRGARYRRAVREHSHGRQGMTWDFMVVQRLDVIEELTRQQLRGGDLGAIRTYLINTQADFIARYLTEHPDSRPARLVGAGRGGPRHRAGRADDLRDLPDDALPPGRRRAEGSHPPAARGRPLHPRAGQRGEPQRARDRRGLAHRRHPSAHARRGHRDHPAAAYR
ncbi:hypothetical protein RPIT_00575 [Tessaracoccus flavus]|uniref:Glycosyltransferase 2-like domain-containing protein n=1 Tax=Tessaracoccus flavus TaxID=1610493 RepID=A0A1Q2CBL1_9ACTN|nr:hypothetical protein RPIT_00575 [Tessaracoccus flavus]